MKPRLLVLLAWMFFPAFLGAETNRLLVPVTINEVPKGEILAYLSEDDVLVPVELLGRSAQIQGAQVRQIGLTEFVSLRSLAPSVTYDFDESNLSLKITVDPMLLDITRLSIESAKPHGIRYSRDSSAFLNYSLNTTDEGLWTGAFESGATVRGGLLYSSLSRTEEGGVVRGLSNLTIDHRTKLRRTVFGDFPVGSDELGGGAIFGGVSVSREFSLNPYFIRYPTLDFLGTANTPSTVEIYVNDFFVRREAVPPGQFQITDLVVPAGSGEARVVVRDAFGNERVMSSPFYFGTEVLARGLSEYSYNLGFVREDLAISSWNYGAPALSAYHRYGFTDWMTAGARVEATENLWSAGATVNTRLRIGELKLGGAFSSEDGRDGHAAVMQYSYIRHRYSIGLSSRLASDHYSNLSLRAEEDRSKVESTAFAGVRFGRSYLSGQLDYVEPRDREIRRTARLTWNRTLSRRLALITSVARVSTGGDASTNAFAGLSFDLGSLTSATLSAERNDGESTTAISVHRGLPVGKGFGYRVEASAGAREQSTGTLQYNGDYGRYEVRFSPQDENSGIAASVAGGVVAVGKSVYLSRPVQGSYALIRIPEVPNVRVYASNQEIGRTNENGDLLVPGLVTYYGNRLSVDERDIPMDRKIETVEQVVAPGYRGGALILFSAQRIQIVTGKVLITDGARNIIPQNGELTLQGGGGRFVSPLGAAGEFYFENLPQGSYEAMAVSAEGTCNFSFAVPSSITPFVKMGTMSCRQEAK